MLAWRVSGHLHHWLCRKINFKYLICLYVTCNYNYMLDSNGTKLKPKKSQVHGMDIWARCHTKNALCGISHSALIRLCVIYLWMYLYHKNSSGAFEDIDLVMKNPTCIYGLKWLKTTIKHNYKLVKTYMYIIVKWDGHITSMLPHDPSLEWTLDSPLH